MPKNIERPKTPEYPALPAEAKLIHTFTITSKSHKIDLPLYEYPVVKDGEVEYFNYFLGWPEKFLNGPLKKLVETSPYWGKTNVYQAEGHNYYAIGITRMPNEEVPKDKINLKVKFYWDQAKGAFSFISGEV